MKHIYKAFQTKLAPSIALSGFVVLTGFMAVTNPGLVYGFPVTPPITGPVNPSPTPPVTGPVDPSPTPPITGPVDPSPVPSVSPQPTFVPSPIPSPVPTTTPTPPIVTESKPRVVNRYLNTGKQFRRYNTKVVVMAKGETNFAVYAVGLPQGITQTPVRIQKTANKTTATFYLTGTALESGNFNVRFYMTGSFGTISESRNLMIKPQSKLRYFPQQKSGFGKII